ncbi:Npt1/Npt2 family nucleotide transporter [Rhabdochlamydiaceae symbiont of Dictyostelium giganteum]|uniref:Npt1/Npt2 family nucleotide transporter n=1 Tax=Rhabdochlamydiaceae symbiont of Dictyostelium giganteum TaxID=3342349 RepID=UPI00384C2A99
MKKLLANSKQWILFALMLGVICFLNTGYSLLKSARNTLAVVDLGKDASSIPFFELFGAMPASIIMVFILTYLLNRHSMLKVFWITLTGFLSFFILFATVLYPLIPSIVHLLMHAQEIPGHLVLAHFAPQFFSMLFFSMAELWKIALLTVLFWSFVNAHLPVEEAKKMYAPLMLGASLGTMLSGPLIKLCTLETFSAQSWSNSLTIMMALLTLTGVLAALLYTKLWYLLSETPSQVPSSLAPRDPLSVKGALEQCLKSPYLLLLGWITLADYIAYTFGEVIFLDILKQKFPHPQDYFNYHGVLSFWNGLLTAVSALFITPYFMKHYRWVVSSLAMPLCLFVTQIPFFLLLWLTPLESSLNLLVTLGSLFYCLVRAAKYTLFDTSKEISFLLLPPLEKIQGKLIIDGICSRVGRAGASLMSLLLITLSGGVLASGMITGVIAMFVNGASLISTVKLGRLVDQKTAATSSQ